MTKTTRKNLTVKAFQTLLAKKEKQTNGGKYYRLERQMIGAVNNRGENLSCDQVREFCENRLTLIGEGGSKLAFGMDDVVICFHKHRDCYGNQIKKQVETWQKIALNPISQFFNPVLSYGLHRGDKLTATDTRYIDKSFIVSQRAQIYSTVRQAIRTAFNLNQKPYTEGDIENYYMEMRTAIKSLGLGDIKGENVGVIFDYYNGEYRAVFIDYGF